MKETNGKNDARNLEAKRSRSLVRRIMADDKTAEAEAWTHYDRTLRKLAWCFAECEHDVNDRISMTWEIALPKLRAGELININALGAYLRGIVRAVSLGELRKRPWLSHSGDTEFLEQSLVDHRTPFDDVSGEQDLHATVAMINDLTVARDRDVIIMEFFEHTSRETMCDAYDVTPLQLSRWISRARKRLRDQAESTGALDFGQWQRSVA